MLPFVMGEKEDIAYSGGHADVFQSLNRCDRNPAFMERFYNDFLNADPRIPEFFAHTNFERQKFVLSRSLYVLARHASGVPGMEEKVNELAAQHGAKGLRVPRDLYAVWLDCLIRAASETDPQWSESLAEGWRELFGEEIHQFLIAGGYGE